MALLNLSPGIGLTTTSIGRSALPANSDSRKTRLGTERSAAMRVISGFALASAVIIAADAIVPAHVIAARLARA